MNRNELKSNIVSFQLKALHQIFSLLTILLFNVTQKVIF